MIGNHPKCKNCGYEPALRKSVFKGMFGQRPVQQIKLDGFWWIIDLGDVFQCEKCRRHNLSV